MSTAVAEPDVNEEALVAQRGDTVLFLARRKELRLIKTPRYDKHGPGGRKLGEEAGECVNFHNGQFVCPLNGSVLLEDGRPADAQEILAWLEDHPRNGDWEDGFWRIDPSAPDISQAELEALMDAVLNVDEDRIREIIRQEEQGWNRERIVATAKASLERIAEQKKLILDADAAAAAAVEQASRVHTVEPGAVSEPEAPQESNSDDDAPLASADPPNVE